MNIGGTQVFSATAKNAVGGTVLGINIQFVVTSGTPTTPSNAPAPLSIASNGNACAGTWDPTVTICTPGTPGIATVYAVANGVSSAPTTVYVHQHIDQHSDQHAPPLGPPPPNYRLLLPGTNPAVPGHCLSNNVDITDTVGPMTWSSSNSGVLTATAYTPPNQINVAQPGSDHRQDPRHHAACSPPSPAPAAPPIEYTTCFDPSHLSPDWRARARQEIRSP